MQDFILLILAVCFLTVVIRKLANVGLKKPSTSVKEIKRNFKLLLLGIILCMIILVIPYQLWILTGSSYYWDGLYIVGASAIVTVVFCFYYYYKSVT